MCGSAVCGRPFNLCLMYFWIYCSKGYLKNKNNALKKPSSLPQVSLEWFWTGLNSRLRGKRTKQNAFYFSHCIQTSYFPKNSSSRQYFLNGLRMNTIRTWLVCKSNLVRKNQHQSQSRNKATLLTKPWFILPCKAK